MSFSEYLKETYGLNEVRGFGGRIPPEGTTYSSDHDDESPGKRRRRRAKSFAHDARMNDRNLSIRDSQEQGRQQAGVRSRYSPGSKEQQPDDYTEFNKSRGKESGLSMSPKQRAKLAADRAERKGQGKRANKIRARMGIGEEVNYVLSHLIDEGYTDCLGSAEIIYESMSDEWYYNIVEKFKSAGYFDDDDPYTYSRDEHPSRVSTRTGRKIQQRVRELSRSSNPEDRAKAKFIHDRASDPSNESRGRAKERRNRKRGPGPRRARQDAMRDIESSGF